MIFTANCNRSFVVSAEKAQAFKDAKRNSKTTLKNEALTRKICSQICSNPLTKSI